MDNVFSEPEHQKQDKSVSVVVNLQKKNIHFAATNSATSSVL